MAAIIDEERSGTAGLSRRSFLLLLLAVAQVSNLLYRRSQIGKAGVASCASSRFHGLQAGSPAFQQVGNLRYSHSGRLTPGLPTPPFPLR
jgi:hypothetical protein